MFALRTITICFANNKGGSGKSTVAVGLATAFSLEHKRVLLIDADEGARCLDTMLAVDENTVFDLNDVVMGNVDYKDAMQFSRSSKGSGTIYNIDAINGAKTIEIDLNFSSDFNMKVYVSNSSNGQFVAADMSSSGSIYSYDVEGYSFFKIVNESDKACYIDTITIK